MNYETIILEEPEPGLQVLTLNRPASLNAMNMKMVKELYHLFGFLQDSPSARVLVLTGAGRGFCSGADLRDSSVMSPSSEGALSHFDKTQRVFSGLIVQLTKLPQIAIAAVNGPAVGAGFSLALAADVIFVGPAASFTPAFINVGLSAGELGSSYFLPRIVGLPRAMEILLTGRTVGADEAERIGLVTRRVGQEDLMKVAIETARVMLGKTPAGLRLTKEAVRLNMSAANLEAAIALEDRNQSLCAASTESYEMVDRFIKKKPPD